MRSAAARRTGPLGCLGRFALFLVLGTVTLNLIYAVFAPWSFFLGGRFHPIAVWQGIGRMHASSGDYVVYFWISPVPGGRTFNFPTFRGWGDLCTPRGERLPLRVAAFMREHPGIDTNGKDVSVSLYRRPWYRLRQEEGARNASLNHELAKRSKRQGDPTTPALGHTHEARPLTPSWARSSSA